MPRPSHTGARGRGGVSHRSSWPSPPGKGCRALPTWVSLGLLALGESPRGHEVFHHSAGFEFLFDGVRVVRIGHFAKFLEMVFWLPCLVLEIVLGGYDVLLLRVIRFLVVSIVAGRDCDPLGHHFCPFLSPLAPFFVPLLMDLDGAARLPPKTIFSSPRTKTVPTASSWEACWVAILSNSMVVFG
jgi:hypothetical protein